MLNGDGNEKSHKTSVGWVIRKKQRAAHIFVHFLAVVLGDYNVKLPETSKLQVLYMEEMSYVFLFTLFFPAVHFSLVAASISHFLTAAIKFSSFSSNYIIVSFVFYISLLFFLCYPRQCRHSNWVERKNRLCCCC